MAKILSIVDTAYRATLEEQDDTALWFTAACRGAGANLTVLLTGAGVNYAVTTQRPVPVKIGTAGFLNPARHQDDLKRLIEKGVPVYFVREDADERGIPTDKLVMGVEAISRAQIAKFIGVYDQIWYW